jgi:hypothetical protein
MKADVHITRTSVGPTRHEHVDHSHQVFVPKLWNQECNRQTTTKVDELTTKQQTHCTRTLAHLHTLSE